MPPQWEDFVRCSPRPDVRKDGELNTFLTEVTADDATEPTAVMRMVENVEAVVQDLLDQAARADETEDVVEVGSGPPARSCSGAHLTAGRARQRARCLEFVRQLRTACVERADAVTAQLLQRADEFATPKNEVLLSFATQRAEVQLGLWINLASKGFRCVRWACARGMAHPRACVPALAHASPRGTAPRTCRCRTLACQWTSRRLWLYRCWRCARCAPSSTLRPSRLRRGGRKA